MYYVDPEKKELKGEVPWSPEMRTKFQNFKKFEIQTPNRTYDLVDPTGGAIDWCQCLDAVRDRYFPPPSLPPPPALPPHPPSSVSPHPPPATIQETNGHA